VNVVKRRISYSEWYREAQNLLLSCLIIVFVNHIQKLELKEVRNGAMVPAPEKEGQGAEEPGLLHP
jgi:hypothetical protein